MDDDKEKSVIDKLVDTVSNAIGNIEQEWLDGEVPPVKLAVPKTKKEAAQARRLVLLEKCDFRRVRHQRRNQSAARRLLTLAFFTL
jgi:hypothetical protein